MPTDPGVHQRLIQCGDHQWAPYVCLCVHLMSGESRQWVAVPNQGNSEVKFQYYCPGCARHPKAGKVNLAWTRKNIRLICIHCVRSLREEYDPRFHNDPEDVVQLRMFPNEDPTDAD